MPLPWRPHMPPLSRNFACVFAASAISSVGDGVLVTAAPLLAASVTSSPTAVAGVRVAAVVPWLMLGLISGVVADRARRQVLMRMVDLVRALVLVCTVLLTLSYIRVLAVVYVTVFLLGSGQTLFDSASQALVAQILPAGTENRERANSRFMSAELLGAALVGPPLGSLLFAWQRVSPFALDAGSFLVSAAILCWVRMPPRSSAGVRSLPGSGVRQIASEAGLGLARVWRNAVLRHLLIIGGIANFTTGMDYGVLVLYATRVLHFTVRTYGFLLCSEAIGGMLGILLVTAVYRRWNVGAVMRASMFVVAATQLGQGLAHRGWFLFSFALLCVNAVGLIVWNAGSVSERQRRITGELFGRTASIFRLTGLGCQSAGLLAGGIVSAAFTLRLPYIAGGAIAIAVIAVPGALWRAPRSRASAQVQQSAGSLGPVRSTVLTSRMLVSQALRAGRGRTHVRLVVLREGLLRPDTPWAG